MATQKRPVGVTIIAIFNLLVGIPCLLGALCTPFVEEIVVGMMESLPKPPAGQQDPVKMVKDQQEFMRKEIPAQKPALIAFAVVQLTYSLLLLVSGIALLSNKSMGRMLAIVAAVLMAATTLGNIVFTAAFVIPATSKWEKQQANIPQQAPQPGAALSGAGSLVCSALIGFGYPAIVLIVLMGGPARQFFSGRPVLGRNDEFDDRSDDYDDQRDDDDRYRDRPDR
jgi:hypothetical protein